MSIETLTQPPVVNGSLTTEKMEQAWNEIYATFLDDMLNLEQKKIFVMAILKGQLANPPVVEAKPQGEARDYDDLLESFIEIAKQRTIERKALRAIIEALKGNTDKAELIAIACDALDGKAARVPPEATPRKERNKP